MSFVKWKIAKIVVLFAKNCITLTLPRITYANLLAHFVSLMIAKMDIALAATKNTS